jgi:methylmalonyl-CoA mutase
MPAEPPQELPAQPATEPRARLALAADFPAATREEWRDLVAAVLAKSGVAEDADPEDALSSTTYDGIRIRPLYTADDAPSLDAAGRPGHPPFVRGATEHGAAATGWDVRTRHADPDA